MSVLTTELKAQLIALAVAARNNAYAKYSGFEVGAAILCASGELFSGTNVENVSSGLTVCAERVAISNAVTNGQREFIALAIASPGAVTPCGACRQFAAEFCDELVILLVDADRPTEVSEHRLSDLLPDAFKIER